MQLFNSGLPWTTSPSPSLAFCTSISLPVATTGTPFLGLGSLAGIPVAVCRLGVLIGDLWFALFCWGSTLCRMMFFIVPCSVVDACVLAAGRWAFGDVRLWCTDIFWRCAMWDSVRRYKCSNKVLHRAVYPRGVQARLTNNFEKRRWVFLHRKTSINFPSRLMIKVSLRTFLSTEVILLYERKEVFLSKFKKTSLVPGCI